MWSRSASVTRRSSRSAFSARGPRNQPRNASRAFFSDSCLGVGLSNYFNNGALQRTRRECLWYMAVKAEVRELLTVKVVEARIRERRYGVGPRIGAEDLQRLDPVHFRELQIHEDQIRRPFDCHFDPFICAHRFDDVEAVVA